MPPYIWQGGTAHFDRLLGEVRSPYDSLTTMTVHDQLVALGADDREARDAATLLARCFPLGRPIVLTDEVVAAARAGDAVLVTLLLAPEVPPEDDEIAALRELADGPTADRELIPLDVG